MDAIRDIRTDYKDFLARLFIDFLLLWMRFFDRIYGKKNGSGITVTTKKEQSNSQLQDKSRQRNEDSKEKANKWTRDVNERSSRQLEATELKEMDSHLGRTEEIHWARNGRHSSNYSESLEEVDSSILESTHDLQRQISALSDYYSDDEDLANKWTTAKRDEAIAESLAIAENLDRGTSDFRKARSTYDSFCEGLEKLRDDFREILEKWKKRNEESTRDLRGSVSVEVHRGRSNAWNRYADETLDWRGSDSSVLNGSLEGSTSRLNESLRQRKGSVEQHRQMLVTHEHLMQQWNTLNRRMSQEYSETKERLIQLEKKKIELYAKVNDQEWKSLSDSCDDLYAQQPQQRDHCKRLTRDMVARRKDVQGGAEICRAAVEGLSSCLSDESQRLKVWSEKKVKFNQIEHVANQIKRQFEERRTVLTETECNSYFTKLTECLRLHTASSSPFLEEWKAMSRRAKEILRQKYLELAEHEERCFEWKEFSDVDEFREEYERYLEAFQEYVPRICQIHERRSPGSTGIFGPKPESVEFNRFYQNYKRKMKAIGEDYSELESSQMRCCQDIENYRELYDVLLGLTEKQRQVDEMLREEESMLRMTQEKLKEYRDSVHLHLISSQGKRLTDEKRQIIEVLTRIEKQLNESNQTFEMFASSLTATRSIVEEIEKAKVLRRHFERLESFAADWEKHKSYEKLFDLISQIENFKATENPQRLKFEDHEERVDFLEKRLPKIVELHQENSSTYLQTWSAYSLEYNESEMEPFSFDEMSKQYETWSSDCERIFLLLENLKREFTGRLQQLSRIDEALSLLSAQGYNGLHVSESANSFTETFDVHFPRVEAASRNFRQLLADFRPVYAQYFELKTGHLQVMKTLGKEQYSSDRLTEKLENCEGLLRGHRDHLERRRIRIKIEELLTLMKEVLFVNAKESENQVKSLEVETEKLIHKCIDLSGQHFSDITQLQIPNLREFLISLDNCEADLNNSEEKLGKYEETLIKEEKTVHEYCNSVRLLTAFITETGERAKVLEAKLEAGEKLLYVCRSFIESYTNQERSFDTHLRDSKRSLAAFKDAFNSAGIEMNDLDRLYRWYCSQFASDTSGDSFRAKCFAELTEMSATIGEYRKRLLEAEHCIKTEENDIRKGLEEGKRDKEGIQHKLVVCSKDISDSRQLLKRCIALLCVITEKKAERERKAGDFKKRLQAENYEEHCKIYQRNPIQNEEIFNCPLCLKATRPHEGIILRECLHKFCKKCLETHIRDSKTAEVACPRSRDQTSCFGIILDKEIQTFGEDVNRLCAARCLSEFKDQNRFVLTCSSCNKLIVDDGQPRCQKQFFTCPYCDKRNCRKCRVVHEGNETCKDYELTLPYRKIVESLKCTLCLEKDIDVAFVPCGHLVCCADCVKKLGEPVCPHCKAPIQKPMKIYLPTNDFKRDDHPKISQKK